MTPLKRKSHPPRDDAVAQPESGYPDNRLPTEPSADPPAEERIVEEKGGSETEFDSPKNRRGH